MKREGALRLLARRFGLAFLVAVIGLSGAGLPFVRAWEEGGGLSWLFRLRGPIAPPDDVVIVSIDRESSERLALPDLPRKWPRAVHAKLLDRLTEQGAHVVVFDVMFQDPRDPAGDRAFADAVRRAGNVILFERIEKDILPSGRADLGGERAISIERRIPPIPELAAAAQGLAPFALPRVPIKVSQVWLFKPEAGEAATLPMLALFAYGATAYEQILALLADLLPAGDARRLSAQSEPLIELGGSRRMAGQVEALRQLLLDEPLLVGRLLERLDAEGDADPAQRRLAAALIAALGGPGSIHLNYYGPPRTLRTLSYHQVLTGDLAGGPELSGRVVLVGAAARLQPGQQDGFYTPFTLESGLDISGVEIAATAFANLLERSAIWSPPPVWEAALLLAWGLVLGLGLRRVAGGWIPLVAAAVGAVYLCVAFVAFARVHLWLPIVVPLGIQLPTALLGAILWRHWGLQREREHIRRALGMHLPLRVVDQLARGIDDFSAATEHAQGICLVTDVEEYTLLAERLAPAALKRLMDQYYAVLYRPVTCRNGVIANVVGDSMLAIWTAERDRPALRKAACDAALDILAAVDDFNLRHPETRLPTRLGLHCGELVLGHVGTADHYEYRPIGDIVNTTSRIEGLGRLLGTKILASADVVAGLEGVRIRPLGRFLLKNKRWPVEICELMPESDREGPPGDTLRMRFAEGLALFVGADFEAAGRCFAAIERELGHDGPTGFYRGLCIRYAMRPPSGKWTGIVRVDEK